MLIASTVMSPVVKHRSGSIMLCRAFSFMQSIECKYSLLFRILFMEKIKRSKQVFEMMFYPFG